MKSNGKNEFILKTKRIYKDEIEFQTQNLTNDLNGLFRELLDPKNIDEWGLKPIKQCHL